MPSINAILRDVRALGSSAPLRAAYEASKRSGFHRVIFRTTNRTRGYRSVPIPFGHLEAQPGARARCLEDAARILDEGLRVFGRRVPNGLSQSWSYDPLTELDWPA